MRQVPPIVIVILGMLILLMYLYKYNVTHMKQIDNKVINSSR